MLSHKLAPDPSLARQLYAVAAGFGGALAAVMTIGFGLSALLGLFGRRILVHSEGVPELVNGTMFTVELALILLALSVGFVAAAGLVLKYPFRFWLTNRRTLRLRFFVAGILFSGLATAAALVAGAIIKGAPLTVTGLAAPGFAPGIWLYLSVMPLAFLVSSFAEELFFRGYLMWMIRWLGASPYIVIIATSIAFAAFHLEFEPAVFILRSLSGVAFAWSVYRLGGIEYAVGAHAAGNIVLALFIPPLSETTSGSADFFDVGIKVATSIIVIGGIEFVRNRDRQKGLAD